MYSIPHTSHTRAIHRMDADAGDCRLDVTLKKRERAHKRESARNGRAWGNHFAKDDLTCRYCPHDHTTHLSWSGQPHFRSRDGRKRYIVARDAEIFRTFCTACAQDIGTSQVVCYQRNTAVGERLRNPLRNAKLVRVKTSAGYSYRFA